MGSDGIVYAVCEGRSMKSNPVTLRRDDLRRLFHVGEKLGMGPLTFEVAKVEEKTLTLKAVVRPSKSMRTPTPTPERQPVTLTKETLADAKETS